MARPREFDIDKAVEAAMNVFWQNGYQGTSLPDLLDGMGIVRGSFYKAFGSKKALFLKVLDTYYEQYVRPALDLLNSPDARGLASIKQVFDAALSRMKDGDIRGCLLCNSAAESAFHDTEIAQVVNRQLEELTRAFRAALDKEATYKQLSMTNRDAEARHLALNYVGLRIMQRSGSPVEALQAGVNSTFAR